MQIGVCLTMDITLKNCLIALVLIFISVNIFFSYKANSHLINFYLFNNSNGTFVPDLISGNNLTLKIDSEGNSCWLSVLNSSIKGNQDRFIKIKTKVNGQSTHRHGDAVSLGLAENDSRFAIRATNIEEESKWILSANYERNDFNTNYSVDNLTHVHNIEYKDNVLKWYIDGKLIAESDRRYTFSRSPLKPLPNMTLVGYRDYTTESAPIQIGCAMLPNGTTVAYFNGTIEWVEIYKK